MGVMDNCDPRLREVKGSKVTRGRLSRRDMRACVTASEVQDPSGTVRPDEGGSGKISPMRPCFPVHER
jgi:hypothetical protein